VQSTRVLGDGSSPRNWKSQEQCVQARIVESFSDVLAGRQDDSWLVARNRGEPFGDCLPLLFAHARSQNHQVTDARREQAFKSVDVVVSLREYERRPASVHSLDDIVADTTVA